MLRTNTAADVANTGVVKIDAGEGVALQVPVAPATAATWATLPGKPATFPPATHTHAQADVTGLVSALAGKAATSHTHTQAQVSGLTDALAGLRTIAPMPIAQGTNLNDVTTPGEHSQQFTAWATPELNYPGGASPVAGRLFVAANVTRTQVTQFYVPFTASKLDIYMRNFYNTWGSWERIGMASDLALKANADHPLLYQSGNRNIASSVAAGWSVAARGTTIMRQGATVTLSLDVNRTGAPIVPPADQGEGDIIFDTVLTLPTGFMPVATGFIAPAKSGTGTRASGWFDRSNASFRIRDMAAELPTGSRITNVITWQTLDPIPTTLPGTPA